MAYEKFREKIVHLQSDVGLFKVEFLDRDGFKTLADNFLSQFGGFHEIRITGYFSETIREALEKLVERQDVTVNVKLICPEFPIQSKRDSRNLEVLKKLSKAGVKIKLNHRLHARFLVASSRINQGLLILGSFDFNTECIGKERYDAGIRTSHPDLVESARELFEDIWSEPESISLEEFIKKAAKH